MSIADAVRSHDEPHRQAVAMMSWRDTSTRPGYVIFHFDDQSTLTFKKVYEIEAEQQGKEGC